MKTFEFDWQRFLERLRTWNEISSASRAACLTLHSNQAAPRTAFGADLTRLLADQWLTAYTDGQRVRLHDTGRPLVTTLLAMSRHPLASPSQHACQQYLDEHFTQQELQDVRNRLFMHGSKLLSLACSETWISGFLSENAMDWVLQRLPRRVAEPNPATVAVAQTLVRQAMTWRKPLPLHELPARFPSVLPERLGRAVCLAVRLWLFFPRLQSADLVAVIGLWPGLTARLHRPPPTPPAALEPGERFHLAFRIEDMTAVLVACAGGGLRIRSNDCALFAKAEEQIVANLIPLPAWLDSPQFSWRARRLSEAQSLLSALHLTTTSGKMGQDLQLVATPAGVQWLAGSAEDRIRQVVQHLQPTERLPLGSHHSLADHRHGVLSVRDLCRRAAQAFARPPAAQFSAWDEFVRWQVEGENPLVEQLHRDGTVFVPGAYLSATSSAEQLEETWAQVLRAYWHDHLFPLGGVELGLADGERLVFRLTDVGRYILGLADRFSYRPEAAEGGEVVVQPNFEIVFLAPAPLAEATLARCAERSGAKTHGRGVGTLFKITKASIFAAAATGMTPEQVLTTLRELSRKPLPPNVEREIQGWFGQCRRVTVRRTVLIHCPDVHTAARVVAASGQKASLLAETIVELQDATFQPNLIKKLKTLGIFV